MNNRYRLEDRLGTGGMATVYRARDLMLERTVAIKVLRMDLSTDPEFRERFKQEARAAASLSHPNIVRFHEDGYAGGMFYLVIEYLSGGDLEALMTRQDLCALGGPSLARQGGAGPGWRRTYQPLGQERQVYDREGALDRAIKGS